MTLIPAAPFDRPCQDPECPQRAAMSVTAGTTTMTTCWEHFESQLLPWFRAAALEPGQCACGHAGAVALLETDALATVCCHEHLIRIVTRTLTPADLAHLAWQVGDRDAVPLLSEDCYDDEGHTLDPLPLGEDELAFHLLDQAAEAANLRRADPAAEPPLFCESRETLRLAQAGFSAATGVMLDDEIAHELVHVVIDGLAESAPFEALPEPDAAMQGRYRERIREILVGFDPQGLAAAGLDARPYHAEAGWLVRRIHGDEDHALEHFFRLVLACFTMDEGELDPHLHATMNRITARLLAEVVLPLGRDLRALATPPEGSPS